MSSGLVTLKALVADGSLTGIALANCVTDGVRYTREIQNGNSFRYIRQRHMRVRIGTRVKQRTHRVDMRLVADTEQAFQIGGDAVH